MAQEILRVENLTKIYPGGVLANYEVNFSVDEGEIHALVGENGAGKSTLMKMLFGIEEITSGSIFLHGQQVKFSSSKEAIANGIGMVHQHMMLVPSLTVAENLMLGVERKKGIFIDKKKCLEETKAISEKYNLHVDAEKRVRDISIGMKQKLEILKTMYRGAKIIILDEPTAVLTPQETDELFEQLKNLKEAGYTIIFISHKLGEVKSLCDRLTILKSGRTMGTYHTNELTQEEISSLMVGRTVSLQYNREPLPTGEEILRVDELGYQDKFGTWKVKGLNFSLKRGEVLGIAGIEGNGQREAMDMITGIMKPTEGKVLYRGEPIDGCNVRTIRQKGIAHISEDRQFNGSAPELSLRQNLTATSLNHFSNRFGWLNNKQIEEHCNKLVADYQVKTVSNDVPIKSLSGGNIQKVIVAREFSSEAEMIVVNQPTRGVDVGAMEFIHKKILEMREAQKSMLLVSADLTELLALCDRIIVMVQGRVVGVVQEVHDITEEGLGLYMLGLKEDNAERLKEA